VIRAVFQYARVFTLHAIFADEVFSPTKRGRCTTFFRERRPASCLSLQRDIAASLFGKDRHMTTTLKCSVACFALLCAASPTYASSCAASVERVQAKLDAAIEKRAGSDGWKRESLSATRNHQPTPRSIAATEGYHGQDLEVALASLARARAADGVGNIAVCREELAAARSILRSQRH
jgi:hypothetical protein